LSENLFDLCRILIEKKVIGFAQRYGDKHDKIDDDQSGQTILTVA
jgi:hypothetical protein